MSDISATPAPSSQPANEAPKNQDTGPSTAGPSDTNAPHLSPIDRELAASKSKEQSSAQQTPEAPTATEVAKEKAKYKLKVNGKETEYDIDTILRKAQLAESADSKFQEAASSRKQVEQLMHMLQTDPMSVLSHPDLGINFEELATNYLTDIVRRDSMDPMQLELEELRNFKANQEKSRKDYEENEVKTRKEREFDAMKNKAAVEYDRKISEVMNKSGLPKTTQAVKRIAEVLYNAHQKGYEIDVESAVDMVRETYLTDIQALMQGLDGDSLLAMLGGDVSKKIQKHNLSKLQAKLNPSGNAPQAEQANQQPTARQAPKPSTDKLSPDEWKEMIRRKAGL